MNTNTSALILVRGLPGSGKSHLAAALVDAIGADKVVILDPDKVDQTSPEYIALSESLAKEGVDKIYFPNRFLKATGYKAIDEGKTIIWNQAFTLWDGFNRSLNSLKDYAAEHGIDLPVLVVEVNIDPEVAKKRISDRVGVGGHDVSLDRFERFLSEYESYEGRGFNLVAVNGNDDVAQSANTVVDALKKISN
jgi:predicted kinase